MTSLYYDLRSEKNLFAAWRHVKRKALNSREKKIRGDASEFEHHHQRYLKTIAEQLRKRRFEFDLADGYLGDKKKRLAKGKDPRPIVVGSIRNRVVQRAILQVLQPRVPRNIKELDTRFTPVDDPRLGKLNFVNRSEFGVGGLMAPYGGVKPAISKIMSAMQAGADFYYQSDIKAFFTGIRTKDVIDIVERETGDQELCDLFARGLAVDLANKDELLKYARIFPSSGVGVAQGSSLSAFAGNVLLYDLDQQLNEMNVTAVRYIDDLLIVSPSETDMNRAVSYANSELGRLGFSLYAPGTEKAAQGKCCDAFKFLGCTIQPNRCVPSKSSLDGVVDDVAKLISDSKREIKRHIDNGKAFDPKLSRSAVLATIGKKVFGWQKSFSFCTDGQQFEALDRRVFAVVKAYESWFQGRTRELTPTQLMQVIGIPSTKEMYEASSKSSTKWPSKGT